MGSGVATAGMGADWMGVITTVGGGTEGGGGGAAVVVGSDVGSGMLRARISTLAVPLSANPSL